MQTALSAPDRRVVGTALCALWSCDDHVFQLLESPLPPMWEKVRRRAIETSLSASDLTVVFKNKLDGREISTHPGAEFLLNEVCVWEQERRACVCPRSS